MLEKEKFVNTLSDIIRKARRSNNFTLEKLSDKSDIDYSTVNLIENGKKNPTIYTIYKILYALDVDLIRLLDDKGFELSNRKVSILNRLEKLDIDTLESISDFLDRFDISKK